MQIHSTHKNSSGFTLIELVIAVAVIGILTSVAVLGYNQYKVRAYDAHSKQALRDILLQCNVFWLDHDTSQVCNHATVAEVYVASDEIVLKFPAEDLTDLPDLPGSQGNFCASAQHVSSPNTYSIDSASLISDTEDCGGAGGSVQTASAGGTVQTASVAADLPDEGCGGYPCGGCTPSDSEVRNRFTQQSNKHSQPENYVVYGDPSGFDWNGNIGARSSGTNSRTEIWQDGCKYFADELGITDYDLSSGSWNNCKYRYNQIVDGTLEGETRRWGAPAHAGTMHAEGMGTPYAKSSMSHGSCGDGPESFKVDNGKPPCSQLWQKGCPQKVGDTWKVNF